MNSVIKAVRSLMDECEAKEVHELGISHLLSVIRGPDEGKRTEQEELKNQFTGPLRLYLLGEEAYRYCMYRPGVENIDERGLDVPIPFPHNIHFMKHIQVAREIISMYNIRSASERGLTT